jgi:uncharacterized spore protein YtfJ
MPDTQLSSVLDKLGVVKDAMTVSRVFGESYQVDGVTIVPVATVRAAVGAVVEKEAHRAGKAPAQARGSDSA